MLNPRPRSHASAATTRGCGGSVPGHQDPVAAGGPANALQEPGVCAEDERGHHCGGCRFGVAKGSREEEGVVADVDVRLLAGREGERKGIADWLTSGAFFSGFVVFAGGDAGREGRQASVARKEAALLLLLLYGGSFVADVHASVHTYHSFS